MDERGVEVMVPLDLHCRPRWYAAPSGLEDTDSIKINVVKYLLRNTKIVLDEKEWRKGWFRFDVFRILCVNPDGTIARKDLNRLAGNVWLLVDMFCMRLLTDT